MIRFNIITPTYNDAHMYLVDTIASVSGQIYDKCKIEIIHTIVDNGSFCLDSLRIIEQIQGVLFVNVIRQSHCGLPAARNLGIQALVSDYILPLNSGDLIHPCLIQEFYHRLEYLGFPKKLLLAPYMISFGTYTRRIQIRKPSLYTILRANYLPVSTLFSTSSAIDYPYDESMTLGLEDWELWIRLISNSHNISILESFSFFHREYSDLTGSIPPSHPQALLYVKLKHLQLYQLSVMRTLRSQSKLSLYDFMMCNAALSFMRKIIRSFFQ